VRSSSHLLSCADMCFDLCLLLQYVATLQLATLALRVTADPRRLDMPPLHAI
jgi:hypothetical protein